MRHSAARSTAYLTAAFMAVQWAVPAHAETLSDFAGPAPTQPSRACAAYLQPEQPADSAEQNCRRAVSYWADALARDAADAARKPRGFQSFGNTDTLMILPPQNIQNMTGELMAAHIDGACRDLRALDHAVAPMNELVLAADRCLSMTYQVTTLGGGDGWMIAETGKTLQKLAQSLQPG